jgi:hypothetical protein
MLLNLRFVKDAPALEEKLRALLIWAMALASALTLSGCAGDRPITGSALALQQAQATSYKLSTGDKLHIVVFGENNLSGDYTITPEGTIGFPRASRSMPPASGHSTFLARSTSRGNIPTCLTSRRWLRWRRRKASPIGPTCPTSLFGMRAMPPKRNIR